MILYPFFGTQNSLAVTTDMNFLFVNVLQLYFKRFLNFFLVLNYFFIMYLNYVDMLVLKINIKK